VNFDQLKKRRRLFLSEVEERREFQAFLHVCFVVVVLPLILVVGCGVLLG